MSNPFDYFATTGSTPPLSHTTTNNHLSDPLRNLATVRDRMDSVQRFLSDSVEARTLIGSDQMDLISAEISSAIRQVIVTGADILSYNLTTTTLFLPAATSAPPPPIAAAAFGMANNPSSVATSASSRGGVKTNNPVVATSALSRAGVNNSPAIATSALSRVGVKANPSNNPTIATSALSSGAMKANLAIATSASSPGVKANGGAKDVVKRSADMKVEGGDEEEMCDKDCDIVELDAVELLAEHIHFCEICGKGFKRDANLRMHMRAHGNQFKTPEALAKPERDKNVDLGMQRVVRFSCPFAGCNRNKLHTKFRPLKSVICVKNHFKRSHCPKMYSCNRCNKKSFSVVADLKSHLKHCGANKWKCSCGTSFSRKDKLFGHMALFEGHMPAVMEDEIDKGKAVVDVEDDEEDEWKDEPVKEVEFGGNQIGEDNGFFDGLLEGFDSIDNFCLQEVLGGLATPKGMDWML